ncbi:MAG: DEAD/DEAH box helicase [Gammaproteobacteria bacterium]|nr:DEAD/DEAH box helicase [Gammaproteobacteria bacterium]
MPQTHLTDIRFDQFDLHPKILAGLNAAGFQFCTPIQAETLPIALAGQDVAGQAQTGTGKTAAFLVVALQRLLRQDEVSATAAPALEAPHSSGPSVDVPEGQAELAGAAAVERPVAAEEPAAAEDPAAAKARAGERARRLRQPRVLILAPTRELAVQIHQDAKVLAAETDFRLGVVYGGTGYQSQRDALAAGVDVLIGTPGRLIDYLKQRVFDLRQVEVVILDEADRMFDLGFIKDIRFVLRRLPEPTKRLGMLFSATLSYRVMELAYEHMNDPKMIEVMPERVTADRVTQRGYMVANDEKIPLLIGLLRGFEGARSMVFVNTKREGERVWGYLEGNGLKAAMLSGDVPQKKRLSLLKRFQGGELPIMVATDVAARGLHIPGVTHVINYDLPDDPEDYVHRIGRTARAGAAGDAISFVCESYAMGWPDIEAFVGARIPVTTADEECLADIDPGSRVRVERRPRSDRGAGGPRRQSSGRGAGRGAAKGSRAANGAQRASDSAASGAASGSGKSSQSAAGNGATGSASNADERPKRRRRSRKRSSLPKEPAPQT